LLLAGCVTASSLNPALAAGSFSLARAVPADSVVYIHGTHNPQSEFIYKHWGEVLDAVCAAQLDAEVKRMILAEIHNEPERATFEQHWDKVVELIGQVEWGQLTGDQFVFFMRMSQFPEFGVLFQPKSGSAQANVDGLVDLLREIASLDDDLKLTDERQGDTRLWRVGTDAKEFSINLFQKGDAVGIVSSESALKSVTALLDGGSGAIVDSAKFKAAKSRVGPAADSISYIDMHGIMAQMRTYIAMAVDKAGQYAKQNDKDGVKVVSAMLEQMDFIDYIIVTERTEGVQNLLDSYVALVPDSNNKPIVRSFTANPPVSGFEKFIPSDSTGFMVWSGVDFKVLYDGILEFVRTNAPDGADLLQQWEQQQVAMGFNVNDDLLSWVDGQMISVTMPPAVKTPMGGADSVLMVKVSDNAKASANVNGWVDKLDSFMQANMGQMLMKANAADVKADGFRSVTHPMLAAMFKLTYGVDNGWLYLSNSSGAINKCLATSRGESASFISTPRFAEEGLVSPKPAISTSFQDLSSLGQELAMTAQALPMATMMIPPSPETQGIRAMFTMVAKLGPAMAKINFMRSTASTSVYDGKGWLTKTKVTYIEYTEKPAKSNGSDLDGL
jgi:hypothetical protein